MGISMVWVTRYRSIISNCFSADAVLHKTTVPPLNTDGPRQREKAALWSAGITMSATDSSVWPAARPRYSHWQIYSLCVLGMPLGKPVVPPDNCPIQMSFGFGLCCSSESRPYSFSTSSSISPSIDFHPCGASPPTVRSIPRVGS